MDNFMRCDKDVVVCKRMFLNLHTKGSRNIKMSLNIFFNDLAKYVFVCMRHTWLLNLSGVCMNVHCTFFFLFTVCLQST